MKIKMLLNWPTTSQSEKLLSYTKICTNLFPEILEKIIGICKIEKFETFGAPGWLSRLSICLGLSSWSQGPGIQQA